MAARRGRNGNGARNGIDEEVQAALDDHAEQQHAQGDPADAEADHQEAGGPGQPLGPGIEALLQVLAHREPARRPFKLPSYSGDGDVELFIGQFHSVRESNQWECDEAILHLRLSLTEKAADCGRGEDIPAILENLRARFGLTQRQAKDRLKRLRRGPQQSLQELGTQAEKLAATGYPNLCQAERTEMALEHFTSALDNVAAERHLLAVKPETMAEAINEADEFLQLGKNRGRVNQIDSPGEINPNDVLAEILKAVQSQGEALKSLALSSRPRPLRAPVRCFNCQGPHYKKDCPHLKEGTTPAVAVKQLTCDAESENSAGPGTTQ